VAVEAEFIPLEVVTAPANRHDSSHLGETLDSIAELLSGERPRRPRLQPRRHQKASGEGWHDWRDLERGKPALLEARTRWVVERTTSRREAHKKLWCTESRGQLVDL
jgi:hypothetical protein